MVNLKFLHHILLLNYITVGLAAHKITKNPMILKIIHFQNHWVSGDHWDFGHTLELILFLQLPCYLELEEKMLFKTKKAY